MFFTCPERFQTKDIQVFHIRDEDSHPPNLANALFRICCHIGLLHRFALLSSDLFMLLWARPGAKS
jgi:hypothetical protein